MQGKLLSNRYLLAEEIGSGGMGSVFRATDLRTGGQVAVKIPHPYLARNEEYNERLRREAQIAASLNSSRIVRVIDLDTDDETPFLVMEFVPGLTLADELRARGRLPVVEALTVGLETARALDAAYQKGIVHRDLKPHNIKLVDGEIKVLDLGIAKAEGFEGVTATNIFMGTPEYSAPERAEGLGDIRSDIYSLGVVLYETVAGHLPFTGLTPMAVIRKHEREPAPPLPPETPEDVSAIVMRCLEKQPEARYQTPRDLVEDISAALRGMPLPTPATGAQRPGGIAPPVLITNPKITRPPLATGGASGTNGSAAAPAAAPAMAPTILGRPEDLRRLDEETDRALAQQQSDALGLTASLPSRDAPTVLTERDEPESAEGIPDEAIVASAPPTPSPVPRRWRALAFAGVTVVGLGVMLAAVMLARGGGTNRDGRGVAAATTLAAVEPSTTPSTPMAAPTPRAVLTGPRLNPPVVAAIPLDPVLDRDERAVLGTLNAALRAQVMAYRNADAGELTPFWTGQGFDQYAGQIETGLKPGRYAIGNLVNIELLELHCDGEANEATVRTREELEYDEYVVKTDERVPQKGYHSIQKFTYHLVRQNGRWLVDRMDADPDPEKYERR